MSGAVSLSGVTSLKNYQLSITQLSIETYLFNTKIIYHALW